MAEINILNSQAITKFCQLADDTLPKLKNKSYSEYKLNSHEWKLLVLIQEVLQEPHNAQQSFLAETQPMLWKAIPILECLQACWRVLAEQPKFEPVKTVILKGLQKLDKWHTHVLYQSTQFGSNA
ncbi:hypothetical protein CPC08DRAFT_769581 [Agrocybe pediades]|nr:hypothetical protein CPC08DRAFT_769581 [Agrocybe pediades]